MKTALKKIFLALFVAISICGNEIAYASPETAPSSWPLIMSTYLGGSGQEGSHEFPFFMDAVEDSRGNLIVAAITTSTDLPTIPGNYQCTTCGGIDILIAKLSPDLTSILAMVKLGGNGEDTYPEIALGNGGRIYILARTTSTNYPSTADAYSRSRRGPTDFVITAFDSLLSTIVASTYFGGYGNEDFPNMVIGTDGDIYVSGHVDANRVPTTPGAFRTTFAGGGSDCFVSRFSPNLDTLKASTLIGGRYFETSGDIDLFPNGDVVIGLGTDSDNYPTTAGAYATALHGQVIPGENVD